MGEGSLTEARVLVIDDDANNRFVLVKLLQVEGVRQENIVALSGDPTSYLRANPTAQFDLVLLDLQIPAKDGFMILGELRQNGRFAHTPIVAVTANVMQADLERAMHAGFHSFLGKPINGPRLGERLRHILAGNPVWKIS